MAAAIGAGALLYTAVSAGAVSFGFERITNNSSADAAGQLSVDVTDDGNGALFDFTVIDGLNPGANVTEVYFDDRTPLFTPPPIVVAQTGASFETGGVNNPVELPGANNASPAFVTTAALVAEADGNNATGLTVGETLILKLVYEGGFGFADVLAALGNGDLRVGLHVRSLLDGESDSFVNTPDGGGGFSVIPLPAAGWLLISGLAGMGVLSRRRKAA